MQSSDFSDAKASEADSEAPLTRVMVVDDNEASAKTLGWTIELLGYDVQLAHDGLAALEKAKRYLPQIILLDIGLPTMNGYVVCEAMRKMPELKDAVIIAQTGWGQKEHLQRSKESGFDHHLVKPVRMETLTETLEKAKMEKLA